MVGADALRRRAVAVRPRQSGGGSPAAAGGRTPGAKRAPGMLNGSKPRLARRRSRGAVPHARRLPAKGTGAPLTDPTDPNPISPAPSDQAWSPEVELRALSW